MIAVNERVTFWLQLVQSLSYAYVYVAVFVPWLTYNYNTITHAYSAANARTHGSDPVRGSQKVTLSSKTIGVYMYKAGLEIQILEPGAITLKIYRKLLLVHFFVHKFISEPAEHLITKQAQICSCV